MFNLKNWFKNFNSAKDKAYSLIEISISIAILATIAVNVLTIYQKRSDAKKYDITYERMAAIQKAMENFVEINQYIPCPAKGNLLESDSAFGVAGAYVSTPSTDVNYLKCTPDSLALSTRRGMVPVYSLGLSAEYAYDGWDRKFSYRVAKGMGAAGATSFGNSLNNGDIQILDGSNLEVTATKETPPFNYGAAYVLISHGPNGEGAFAKNSTAAAANPPSNVSSSSSVESPNFALSGEPGTYILGDDPTKYDDIVVYSTKLDFVPLTSAQSPIGLPKDTCADINILLNKWVSHDAGITDTRTLINLDPLITTPSTFTSKFMKWAAGMKSLCENPPSYPSCGSFSPKSVKTANLRFWVDGSDPTNVGSDTAVADGASLVTWTAKVGPDQTQISATTPPLYRYTTPFPNYNKGANPRHAIYFQGNANSGFFSNYAGASSIFTYPTQSDVTVFVVEARDVTGYAGAVPSFFLSTQDTLNPALGLDINMNGFYLGYGNIGGSTANYTMRLTSLNNVAVSASIMPDYNTYAPPAIHTAVVNSQYYTTASAPYNDAASPYSSRVLAVKTIDGNQYFASGTVATATPLDFTGARGTSQRVFIGTNPDLTSTFYKGYIGEIIVYNAALSAEERAQVESYLVKKWFTGECQ